MEFNDSLGYIVRLGLEEGGGALLDTCRGCNQVSSLEMEAELMQST